MIDELRRAITKVQLSYYDTGHERTWVEQLEFPKDADLPPPPYTQEKLLELLDRPDWVSVLLCSGPESGGTSWMCRLTHTEWEAIDDPNAGSYVWKTEDQAKFAEDVKRGLNSTTPGVLGTPPQGT